MNQKEWDWPSIYAARRERLRASIRARGLDALLVCKDINRFYLSGFELHDCQPGETSGILIISVNGDDWLATDSRYADAARAIWPHDKIFIYGAAGIMAGIAAHLRKVGAIVGIEMHAMSLAFAASLHSYCNPLPTLQDAGFLVEDLRAVKEPCELAALRSSFALNHKMLAALENRLASCPGLPEKALAWDIEKFFRENGAQELAFATIVAAGANAARPHAIPGDSIIKAPGSLLVDLGCRVDNYCSDQTRTWWIGGRPDAKFSHALELVKKAQAAGIAAIRDGIAASAVYAAARKVFEDANCEDAFTHGLGHGVGLETHERPSLSAHSGDILRAGMVVTVEPGLYYPEWGGARWENTVLVRENDAEIL